MSTKKEDFYRMVDWYRANMPMVKRVVVDMTCEEMDKFFKKQNGQHYFNEFTVVRQADEHRSKAS